MTVLLIDAYDSFVYVISQYFKSLGAECVTIRSSEGNPRLLYEIRPQYLVLGPGPSHPVGSGHIDLIEAAPKDLPVLGVCLGHQAIAEAFGMPVVRARRVVHGKRSVVEHDGRGVFSEVTPRISVTRYHSLIADPSVLPDSLEITATAEDDGYVMGLRHKERPIEGVQFHPESVLTEEGMRIFSNFLSNNRGGIFW
jgi:anthranilate synthase component 2